MIAQLDTDFFRAGRGRTLVRLGTYFAFEGRPAVTRGQFVNPAVLAHLRAAANSRPTVAVEQPIFVVGMGRSGTTVLGLVLGTHPEVGYLNEPKALWHVIRPDEDIIGSYAAEPGRLRLGPADADEGARHRAHALYSWYLRATRSSRVVDKYPELVFRDGFVRGLFPDAHLLVVTRQPWATISSVGKWSADHADGTADWWGVHDRKWRILWDQGVAGDSANADVAELGLGAATDSQVRAAIEWVVTMRAALAVCQAGDARVHTVRYEDLTADPVTTVGAILEETGLARSPRTLAYAAKVLRPGRQAGPIGSLPSELLGVVEATADRLRE